MRLRQLGWRRSRRLDRDFRITGMILLPAFLGLAVFGLVLGMQFPKAQFPMLGAAALVACVGPGLPVRSEGSRVLVRAGNRSGV